MTVGADQMNLGTGFLQHRSAGGCMCTERVNVRERGWPHVGQWQARFEGRWRVVHVSLARTWIVYRGERDFWRNQLKRAAA